MNSLHHFFYMGGYGFYVWSAYASAFTLLALQWFIPWRRYRKHLQHAAQRYE